MDITPLAEPGHRGYLLAAAELAIIVDPPLDTAIAATAAGADHRIVGVIETGIPRHRIAGGRLAAEAFGVELFAAPGAIAAAAPLTADSELPLPELRIVPLPSRTSYDLVVIGPGFVAIGDLDTDAPVPDQATGDRIAAARRKIAGDHIEVLGSKGRRPGTELTALADPPIADSVLNETAVVMTNRGEADLYWADPRFVTDAPAVPAGYLDGRLGTGWAPTVVDLTADGAGIDGAIRMSPASLATEIGLMSAQREIIVVADSSLAARAAGFLARLGMNSKWIGLDRA